MVQPSPHHQRDGPPPTAQDGPLRATQTHRPYALHQGARDLASTALSAGRPAPFCGDTSLFLHK
jgi:hypothetical protein